MTQTTATTQRRGRGRPRRELDERALLDAAAEVFARDGYFAARVEDIAQAAGVTKPLLFRRYETKDALFDLAVEHEIRSMTEHLFSAYEAGEDQPVREALRAGVDAIFGYAEARPAGFRLLFQTGFTAAEGTTTPFAKVRALVTDRIAEVVAERLRALGAPHGPHSAAVLATAIVGASEHVARHVAADPTLDPVAVANLLTDMLSVGMKGLDLEAIAAVDNPKKGTRTR